MRFDLECGPRSCRLSRREVATCVGLEQYSSSCSRSPRGEARRLRGRRAGCKACRLGGNLRTLRPRPAPRTANSQPPYRRDCRDRADRRREDRMRPTDSLGDDQGRVKWIIALDPCSRLGRSCVRGST
jgi:hypothetical protein